MNEGKSIACPSSRATQVSSLLGIRQEDGTIAILPQVLPVDSNFIQIGQQDPVPLEQRFRFTNKCVENGCKQWTGKGCGVVDGIIQSIDQIKNTNILVPCSIRPSCRWFLQKGDQACRICPYVLTEITEEEINLHALKLDH
ncbi:MAG: hypothetical protein ABI315_05675 [Bacteroidia bacterium]